MPHRTRKQLRYPLDLLRVNREFATAFNQRAAAILDKAVLSGAVDRLGECVCLNAPHSRELGLVPGGEIGPREHRLADYGARYDRNLAAAVPLVDKVNKATFLAARLDLDSLHIRQVGHEFDELVAVGGVDERTRKGDAGIDGDDHR